MRLLLMVMTICLSTNSFANDSKILSLYRADAGKILVEGGFDFISLDMDYKSEALKDTTNSYTTTKIAIEYNVSELYGFGFEASDAKGPTYRGMNDYELYLQGKYKRLYYELKYFHSFEDSRDDNIVSGGSHYSIELGGLIYNQLGAILSYTPAYTYTYSAGTSSDNDVLGSISYAVFYEMNINENTYGVSLQIQSAGGRRDKDGDEFSEPTTYQGIRIYGAIDVGPVTFLPGYTYLSLTDGHEDSFKELSVSNLELMARIEF